MSNDDRFFDPDDIESWRPFLDEFRDAVYPMFASYGISFGEALNCWIMNRLNNTLDKDNDDDWKLA
jgi:hypothetical protein